MPTMPGIDIPKINKLSKMTNDKIIREFLMLELNQKYSNDNSVRVIQELGLNHGSARVDIAVLNGVMHGYEIKSDADTLYRLPSQIRAYNAVFKKMTIAVGAKHLEEVINLVPDWWEIVLIRQKGESITSYQIRKGLTNRHQDREAIAQLLWKAEAVDLLRSLHAERGVVSQPRNVAYKRLADLLDTATLQKHVKDALFARTNWRAGQA